MTLRLEDQEALERAFTLLEHPSFAAKVTNLIGTPMEKALSVLPDNWTDKLMTSTKGALSRALDVAVATLNYQHAGEASNTSHKVLTSISGALGGAFGLGGLAVELPISTTIMLRSIADIARSEGENILDVETKLSCLEVFALGGPAQSDDGSETGYFAVRTALGAAVTEAAKYITERGMAETGAPGLVRLVTQIASRYSIQVSEKAAAQAIPIIGAAGGATINLLFINHFQDVARGHFTVRRLERIYDPEIVKSAYEALAHTNNQTETQAETASEPPR